jgi:hypothetical protein
MLDKVVPFGEQFSMNARMFGFNEHLNKQSEFWYEILQTHDSYGVPFDLIYQKMKSEFGLPLSADEFEEFMKMVRYGAEMYGIGKQTKEKLYAR